MKQEDGEHTALREDVTKDKGKITHSNEAGTDQG